MRNVILLVVFLSASFTLSADVKPVHEIQKVFLKALNDKHLDEVFEREECEDFYPFHLVTNELIDHETVSLLEGKFSGTANFKSDVKSLAKEEILELDKLKKLEIARNKIKSFPDKMEQLKSLTDLDLSHNPLKVFPLEILNLPALKSLDLSYCEIEEIPVEIALLCTLKTIIFTGNSDAAVTKLKWLLPDLEVKITSDKFNF